MLPGTCQIKRRRDWAANPYGADYCMPDGASLNYYGAAVGVFTGWGSWPAWSSQGEPGSGTLRHHPVSLCHSLLLDALNIWLGGLLGQAKRDYRFLS